MLKKFLLTITVAAIINQASYSMEIKEEKSIQKTCENTFIMPNKEELEKLFSNHNLGYFANKTNIIDALSAGKEMDPLTLPSIELTMLQDFQDHVKNKKFSKLAVNEAKKNLKKLIAELIKKRQNK